ncbi:RNA-directed DNA polymerase [Vibrio parahaemolyticus]|uniref:RNA-directed DNA polymerase n=1 Tax=Vibrio parahaemolyticus TaxID=670 RepID=UPI00111DC3DB|nr:RNA-directed DNA polymerase [Vibrio parahaemolyticus]TNZ95750.1 reverse transcriptase [Vibrio parahaemolyticus]
MQEVKLEHFVQATREIAAHGDNDTLPFDIDNRFVSDNVDSLSKLAFDFFSRLEKGGKNDARRKISEMVIFHERLLSPTGASGFRIATKIHPFWNIYMNGLGVSIADAFESKRSSRAHSYRYIQDEKELFDRSKSWRAYKEATLEDPALSIEDAVVVQTDISSFYEHISHHKIENCISDLFSSNSSVASQIDRILSQMSSGRSFGLPVGGQCSRILAELLMHSIDELLTQNGLIWHRYVDDFTLIAKNQSDAYKAISILANALADYGLSLNRTKTTFLSSNHYKDFVTAQLFSSDDNAGKLREIDVYFDPYSDDPEGDYDTLKETVEQLDIQNLLGLEVNKSQPDSYLVSQVSRTLQLHEPREAYLLCKTLLSSNNLHSLRASWKTIIKGVADLRGSDKFNSIHSNIDVLLDSVLTHSTHLLIPETNSLHFLRAIRFAKTERRARYIHELIQSSTSQTVKRACIDCIRHWGDRPNFNQLRNNWLQMGTEAQRMYWLASNEFGDEGENFQRQVGSSLEVIWKLGVESKSYSSFTKLYLNWVKDHAHN